MQSEYKFNQAWHCFGANDTIVGAIRKYNPKYTQETREALIAAFNRLNGFPIIRPGTTLIIPVLQ